ncbi:hypothetical protein V2G26_007279 [Clonostachys chloroleuca]
MVSNHIYPWNLGQRRPPRSGATPAVASINSATLITASQFLHGQPSVGACVKIILCNHQQSYIGYQLHSLTTFELRPLPHILSPIKVLILLTA